MDVNQFSIISTDSSRLVWTFQCSTMNALTPEHAMCGQQRHFESVRCYIGMLEAKIDGEAFHFRQDQEHPPDLVVEH